MEGGFMIEKVRFHVAGVVPMLMHNGQLANPLNKWSKEMKKVSSKRKKTDEDYERMAYLEFMGGLYLDEDLSPCVPGEVLTACIIEGAKKQKRGTAFKPAVFVQGNYPLIYKGPRDPESLWKQEEFRDIRGVRVGQAKVMRTRPRFKTWELKFEVDYNPKLVNKEEIEEAVVAAGQQCGIGDHIPQFGRFSLKA